MTEQTTDDLYTHIKAPTAHHTYYVCAEVKAREDWNTKRIEIEGRLGIAPNNTTMIEYPIHVWISGYFKKAEVKRLVGRVKHRLLAEMKAIGYSTNDLTEPLEVSLGR